MAVALGVAPPVEVIVGVAVALLVAVAVTDGVAVEDGVGVGVDAGVLTPLPLKAILWPLFFD